MTNRAVLDFARIDSARACVGAVVGIAVTGLIVKVLGTGSGSQSLLAPMGAAAVLLFAVPDSPLARPWNVIAGNVVSAIVGVLCAAMIGDPVAAAAIACAVAIAVMLALGCLHPPGGAVAMTAVAGGASIVAHAPEFVLLVGLNATALLLSALLVRRLQALRAGRCLGSLASVERSGA